MRKEFETAVNSTCRELDVKSYGGTAIHVAAADPTKSAQLRELVMKSEDLNAAAPYYNRTPLMFAALYGNVENAIILIAAGADTMALDRNGYSAHDIASDLRHQELAYLIKTAGPIIKEIKTPAEMRCKKNDTKKIRKPKK